MTTRKRGLNIVSLFSGCGGLDLGFHLAKHNRYKYNLVWANDFFKAACKTFEKNFKLKYYDNPDQEVKHSSVYCGDITKFRFKEKLGKMEEKRIMESIEILKEGEIERFCSFMNIKLRSLPCFFRAIMKSFEDNTTFLDPTQELEKILSINVKEECNYCTIFDKDCEYVKNRVYTIIKGASTSQIEKIMKGFKKDEEIGLKLLFKNLKMPYEYLPCARRTIRYILTQNEKKFQN